MRINIRKWGVALAATLLAVACFGFAAPALADGEQGSGEGNADLPMTTDLESSYLTKVVLAPPGTDITNDRYTFSFTGSGTVQLVDGELMSGGVEQDSSLKVKDVVPPIGDVVLVGGGKIDTSNSNGSDESTSRQYTVQKKLSDFINDTMITFNHAGVYTYRVTETSTDPQSDKVFISPSQASYLLKIVAKNEQVTNDGVTRDVVRIAGVTVTQESDDDGVGSILGKIDPTYPKLNGNIILHESPSNQDVDTTALAGRNGSRGRNVYGFTFANEYVSGAPFTVTKLVRGTYGDKTKEFTVKLELYDPTAIQALGCCVTYAISKGTDATTNPDEDYVRHDNSEDRGQLQLDGVPEDGHNMALFDNTGRAVITANLRDGGSIQVLKLYGFKESAPIDDSNNYRRKFTDGVKGNTTYTVTETPVGGYSAAGFANLHTTGENGKPEYYSASAFDWDGTHYTVNGTNTTPTANPVQSGSELKITGQTGSSDGEETAIFVMNTISDSQVTPMGIFVDNLPYILMIGVPLGIFGVMFALKRRGNAAA